MAPISGNGAVVLVAPGVMLSVPDVAGLLEGLGAAATGVPPLGEVEVPPPTAWL